MLKYKMSSLILTVNAGTVFPTSASSSKAIAVFAATSCFFAVALRMFSSLLFSQSECLFFKISALQAVARIIAYSIVAIASTVLFQASAFGTITRQYFLYIFFLIFFKRNFSFLFPLFSLYAFCNS